MQTINEQYLEAYKTILDQTDLRYPKLELTKKDFLLFIKVKIYNHKREKYSLKLLKKLNKQYIHAIK